MNIPPERTGRMNASVAKVMATAGAAINATFHHSVAEVIDISGPCGPGVAELTVPAAAEFDYIMTMEDLSKGQRVANYSVSYLAAGSSTWAPLVPPVTKGGPDGGLTDRPDGHDPRDSHIGHKRIDLPVITTAGPGATKVMDVRKRVGY